MKVKETYIFLKDVTFYAYHGVGLQENIVGNTFVINLKLKTTSCKAMETDDIEDTVNYAEIYNVLSDEMSNPSKLLEHVCSRIAQRVFHEFPTVSEIELKLSKQNPPVGADITSAGFELHCCRE